MDILIKNMEMPKNCLSCPMKEHCPLFNALHFNERLKMLDESIRVDGCPLVALPEHGDLIDRDKASTQIIAEICQFCASAEDGNCDGCLVQKCLEAIGRAPVIVEATE